MRIGEYFHQIEETIGLCPGVWMKTMLYDERSETKGFVRGLMHFEDGSELHLREFVDVISGIDRYKYAYHYMREGRMVFRYDNASDITARALVLATTVPTQCFQPVTGQPCQVREARCAIEDLQAAFSLSRHTLEATYPLTIEQGFGVLVAKAPYHA